MKFTKEPGSSIARWRSVPKNAAGHGRVRIALVICLLAVLPVSLLLGPLSASTAQERNAEPNLKASEVETTGAVKFKTFPTETFNDSADAVCGWTVSTVFPVPILDQAVVAHGSNLYTFGGVSNGITFANSYKFDGGSWTSIAPLPLALESPSAVSDGAYIYILGGADVNGTSRTSMFRYDPSLNSYASMAPFSVGTWNQATVYLDGKIYKFAGTGNFGSVNALEIYNIATNTWAPGAPYPLAISFVSAFVHNGYIYGAGGYQSSGGDSLKTFRYDPQANAWDDDAIADLPLTRWAAASSGISVGIGANAGWVIAGGYENGGENSNTSATAISWDPQTNIWSSLNNMTGERTRMAGAVLNGSFYVIGGRSFLITGFIGTNLVQRMSCSPGAIIAPGTVSIVSESLPPGNGAPDPGETITVSLPLSNGGEIPTTALTATLQATGGVTNPSEAQSYGVIQPTGAPGAVTKNFTFRVDPAVGCGSMLTLTWAIADGTAIHPNAVKIFITGAATTVLTENFDGVSVPALPAGWASTQTTGTGIKWTTTATTPYSAPNAAFGNTASTINAAALSSPAVLITGTSSQLVFKNKYITEATFDGTVLEYSTNGGATWTDIVTGGGSFLNGGYNGVISTAWGSPIGGRSAWTGTSAGGYIDTLVNLPASLNGQSVKFRWLTASDDGTAASGHWIDNVQVLSGRTCSAGPIKSPYDFDGDSKTDISIYRPSLGQWWLNRSTAGVIAHTFGNSADIATPGDFTGDGKADVAIFRPSSGTWFVLRSEDFSFYSFPFGSAGDITVPADYDGDGKTDAAVFRPSNATWYIQNSAGGTTIQSFGAPADRPVQADYDGDGKADIAIYRPSLGQWWLNRSTAGVIVHTFGNSADRNVPGDYTGDGKADIAIWRPSSGEWFVLRSEDASFYAFPFGAPGDVPVPGDYDGDGKFDAGVFRPSNATWYLNRSASGLLIQNFGLGTDIPVPNANVR